MPPIMRTKNARRDRPDRDRMGDQVVRSVRCCWRSDPDAAFAVADSLQAAYYTYKDRVTRSHIGFHRMFVCVSVRVRAPVYII